MHFLAEWGLGVARLKRDKNICVSSLFIKFLKSLSSVFAEQLYRQLWWFPCCRLLFPSSNK